MKPKWMQQGVCYRCSYDLRGLPAGTCPECGTELSRGAYKRFLAQRSRVDHWILGTMLVTGLGAFPIALLAAPLLSPRVSGFVFASALSLVAAVASCWFFCRVLARDGVSRVSASGVVAGLSIWAAMMCMSYMIFIALAVTGSL